MDLAIDYVGREGKVYLLLIFFPYSANFRFEIDSNGHCSNNAARPTFEAVMKINAYMLSNNLSEIKQFPQAMF